MRFCPWYPLSEAASRAPAGEGVLQLRRASGLVDYPRGKSAMVRYAYASDVRDAALALARELAGQDLLCRHLEDGGSVEVYAQLVDQFERRFGARPGESPS